MADGQKGKGEDDAAGFEALEQDYQGVRHRVPPPRLPTLSPPGGPRAPPGGKPEACPLPEGGWAHAERGATQHAGRRAPGGRPRR